MAGMTIGELADRAGVGVETVRFYERKGLIRQPARPVHGYRTYSDELLQRLRFIRQAQELGFSLREVDELLAITTDPGSDCADLRDRAAAKLAEVRAKRDRLGRLEQVLVGLVDSCPGSGGLDACTILDAIGTPLRERR